MLATASYTSGVVQAKLILPGGKDLGPHLFFVQLRSMGKFFLLSDSWHIYFLILQR